jgi:hypothetical protein
MNFTTTDITKTEKRFICNTIIELWGKFMPEKVYEKEEIEDLKVYEDNFYILTKWLKNDVTYLVSLVHSEREKQDILLEDIVSWIKERGGEGFYTKICMGEFSLEKIKQRLEIQSNWEKALDDVKENRKYKGLYEVGFIASTMDFSLSEENLSQLALIYKNAPEGSKRRMVIEQLLEDINYHAESSDFSSGNVEKYIITKRS